MRVTMILCDAAEEVGGKLYILGGGFTHVLAQAGGPATLNMALGVVVAVPWTETNTPHPIEVSLVSEDGDLISIDDREVKTGGKLELGRPVGVKPGSDLNAVLAFRFNGLVLEPGGYVWQLDIGSTTEARTPFWVVDPTQGAHA
jgi:hypothetical protein